MLIIGAFFGPNAKPITISRIRWTLSLPAFASLIPQLIVPYAGAAVLTLANLNRDNPMARHRVGLALPVGMRALLVGIGKLAGAIVLLLPRLATLKEWVYAGFTFMWIAVVVAHFVAGDGAYSLLPVALIGSLAVSYVTRPANRRGSAESMLA